MKVIGVVGFPASGKGEFSRIAREMGIPVVVMGDIIRQAAVQRGLEPNDENLGYMAQKLRTDGGMKAIAVLSIPIIERQKAPIIVVDGIRGDDEVVTFRQHFKNFHLIGIRASFSTRLKRLNARQRPDDPQYRQELIKRDHRECSWGLEKALSKADYTLENEGSLESFERNTRKLLSSFKGEMT